MSRMMMKSRSYCTIGISGLLCVVSATISWGAYSHVWLSLAFSSRGPSRLPAAETSAGVPPVKQPSNSGEITCNRRATLMSLGFLAAASDSRSARSRIDWLAIRTVDPRAKEWWGRGGTMSESEVQKAVALLSPLQQYVLLEGGVEDDTDGRKFVNGYDWDNTESGVYVSAVSGAPLFSSRDKMEDAVGWPGFRAPISLQSVVIRPDPRDPPETASTEVLDRKSMTHLGHILDDGHYCINAASLRFIPAEAGRKAAP
eukprot:TRINITY_DN59533_c0_g1_i1.p1 TRINITY_DN59533_c0_g1~~TRINITY_DN59533_c0_g1_i1.p1  ORF type:complete len:257 (+),score=32.45 TRINITY_DN59533_c0_g1_i1:71-841(+)